MQRSRWVDVLFVTVAVALGAWSWRSYGDRKPAPGPALPSLYAAASFETESLEGGSYRFDGKGPLLLLMAAPGCPQCGQRAPLYGEAVEVARRHGVPVTFLFFGEPSSGAGFRQSYGLSADRFLADPAGSIISQYRGSDPTSWVVIDRNGQVVWQGADDPATLDTVLSRVEP
ncbi:MAG: hypothetical protein AB1758_08465 [Candidatus Eremiobacterota bacterium]